MKKAKKNGNGGIVFHDQKILIIKIFCGVFCLYIGFQKNEYLFYKMN